MRVAVALAVALACACGPGVDALQRPAASRAASSFHAKTFPGRAHQVQASKVSRREQLTRLRGGADMSAMALFTDKIAPTLGTAIANGMFLSGVPAIQAARKAGTMGSLNPVPFAMIFANCVAWLSYGFVTKNPYVFYSNALGSMLGLYMTMTGVRLAEPKARVSLERLVLVLGSILVASGYIVSSVLTTFEARRTFSGLVANGMLMLYYGAPLTALSEVIKKRDSSSLLWPLAFMSLVNGSLWAVYGSAVNDMLISIPNAIGAVFSLFQLSLCVLLPAKKTAASAA